MEQVIEFFVRLFDASDFPKRWGCGNWTAFHGWFNITSDAAIWAAYFAIPGVLYFFVRKRKDLPFPRIFYLFCAFIFACGLTHLMDVIIFWWPNYRLSGVLKFYTAVVSWITVAALIPVVPRALSLRSPEELEREIVERKKAEAELQHLNENLEEQVLQRTRQLQRANKEMEAFTYSVSHDLKSPVRKINVYSGKLLSRAANLSDEDREDLGRISQNCEFMMTLVEDLLDFSRSNNWELNPKPLDLSRMMTEVCHEQRELEPERPVEFVIQENVTGQGDRSLIAVVLRNLVSNAWKYTRHAARPRIEFSAEERVGETVYTVRDNGIGFEMKYAAEIFFPFKRLHSTTEYPGSGIGLSTVQRIIDRHEGRVWVESEPGQGAAFHFTLGSPQNGG